jgi:Fic family protein
VDILRQLSDEKNAAVKGGLYHQTQIKLSFNSNRIEGSRLSEEQTRYIFETNTVGVTDGETANVDDIIETVNHFACFDYLLVNAEKPLSECIIKEFHRLLKQGTRQSRLSWFNVGEYKSRPNMVGNAETTPPNRVAEKMSVLLGEYNALEKPTVADIITFHVRFENIHPFQDGNGRVGRLIMFKECLKYGICPFIIGHEHKLYYYRGLKEYNHEQGVLTDTCLPAQDEYAKLVRYFME